MDRMPDRAKTPPNLGFRKTRAFRRARRRKKPTPDVQCMLRYVDEYKQLELKYVHIYEIVSGKTLRKYHLHEDDGQEQLKHRKDSKEFVQSQTDIMKFIKRHCELFRVHFHGSMEKR